jgi:hypothetical protein
MNVFWTWAKAKFGRIVTAIGVLLSGIDVFDITPIKDPLTAIIGAKGVQIAVVACFVLSWARHQYVASKVAPKPGILPPPVVQP